jgi:hypothetical protein
MVLIGMVIVCLMMAVDFQFRVVEGTRPKIEEAQLARVLLHRIAEDVRNVTPKGPTAASSSDSEDESSGAASGTSGGTNSQNGTSGSNNQSGSGGSNNQNNANGENNNQNNTGGDSNSQTGTSGNNQTGTSGGTSSRTSSSGGSSNQTGTTKSSTSSQNSQSSGSTDSSTDTSTSTPAAKLRGGTDWIQVDVCRLPRFDQWESLLLAAESGASPSQLAGLKTVSYFLRSDDSLALADLSQDSQTSGGLMRREADWAPGTTETDTEATPAESSEDAQSLANEVTELGFRYSDGTDWLDEWDSTESGQLPVAVEITLSIRPRTQTTQQDPLAAMDAEADSLIYRLVVNLPAAQISSDEIQTDMPNASEGKETSDKEMDSKPDDNPNQPSKPDPQPNPQPQPKPERP